jgi:hypothetical protein
MVSRRVVRRALTVEGSRAWAKDAIDGREQRVNVGRPGRAFTISSSAFPVE